jgi:hypothetical protein
MGAGGEGISNADGSPAVEREGVGVLLDCPCGHCDEFHQLYVPFANPIDGGPPFEYGKNNGWQRTGETFDTLQLSPSILRTKEKDGCGWHGYIGLTIPGEVTTC